MVKNCSITVHDIDRAIKIFGISEPLLYGRMTAPSPTAHPVVTIYILYELNSIYKHLQLYIDICYINKMVFMVTRTDSVNYITIDYMENKKKKTIITHIIRIIDLY